VIVNITHSRGLVKKLVRQHSG